MTIRARSSREPSRVPRRLTLAAVVRVVAWTALLLATLLDESASAQPAGPRTATLTILGGSVRHVTRGGEATAATDGMDLAVGDRVITGRNASAVVTFGDGSTLTVQPGSDIAIRRADLERDRSNIVARISLGTVWARVVRLADPGSGLALESNTATATVHDGLIGADLAKDGTLACWTQAGELRVRDPDGRPLTTLAPGEIMTVRPGGSTAVAPFAVTSMTLRVTVSTNLLPLVRVPDFGRVAGFVAPGVEVNQVYGSVTAARADAYVVEVPAGSPGPFDLTLEGRHDGPFTVVLQGLFRTTEVYRLTFSGTIARGARLSTAVQQRMFDHDWENWQARDYRTARAEAGWAAPLRPMRGALPGRVVISSTEVQALEGR